MENRIVCLYLSLSYCAILWAACQPQPAHEDDCWRLNESVRICQKKEMAAAGMGE